jgi:hypothetical protein
VLSLKWADVNFAAGRMTVPSPKTEHLEGKEYRVCPIFSALRPHLEDAFELAEPGAEYVVGGPQGDLYRANSRKPGGWQNTSLSSAFRKLIKRAGLVAWPRLFHNMRASCETDLMQHHPIHVVTAWIGNTPKIALAHYLQTLDADVEKAVQGGAVSGALGAQIRAQTEADGMKQKQTNPTDSPDISGVLSGSVGFCPIKSIIVRSNDWPRWDLNPHVLLRSILSRVRLPFRHLACRMESYAPPPAPSTHGHDTARRGSTPAGGAGFRHLPANFTSVAVSLSAVISNLASAFIFSRRVNPASGFFISLSPALNTVLSVSL